jgi:hypothetical protein
MVTDQRFPRATPLRINKEGAARASFEEYLPVQASSRQVVLFVQPRTEPTRKHRYHPRDSLKDSFAHSLQNDLQGRWV